MNKKNLLFVFFVLFVIYGCSNNPENQFVKVFKNSLPENGDNSQEISERIANKAKIAEEFCKEKNFNTDYCILIDMSIHSGKHRMFVYDFKNKTVEHRSLCAHGIGKDDQKSTPSQPKFSNVQGSLLSSLGKYRIGDRAYSQWGINVHYKLHGLESTNSNAYKRIVVLHSHTPVAEDEIFPSHLPLGWSFGCPVTDDKTMKYLDKKLQKSQKPVLLWVFNGDEK